MNTLKMGLRIDVVILFVLGITVSFTLGARPEFEEGNKIAEKMEIESFALEIKNMIENMTDPYDRTSADNIHTMWYNKMLDIEYGLRTNTAPVLKNEVMVDDSQVELFGLRVHRKINNWPDVEHEVGFKIHGLWYEKAKGIEKILKKKYKRTVAAPKATTAT